MARAIPRQAVRATTLWCFRMELMRVWYGLSDGEVEEQANDRLSFSRFVGLGMDDDVPDSTTLCRFRNALVKSGAYNSLLSEVNRQLESRRVMVTSSVIVDASVTDTPRRSRKQKKYEVVGARHEDDRPGHGQRQACGGAASRRGHGGLLGQESRQVPFRL